MSFENKNIYVQFDDPDEQVLFLHFCFFILLTMNSRPSTVIYSFQIKVTHPTIPGLTPCQSIVLINRLSSDKVRMYYFCYHLVPAPRFYFCVFMVPIIYFDRKLSQITVRDNPAPENCCDYTTQYSRLRTIQCLYRYSIPHTSVSVSTVRS